LCFHGIFHHPNPADEIVCLLKADTPVDWSVIHWQPKIAFSITNTNNQAEPAEFLLPVSTRLCAMDLGQGNPAPIKAFVPDKNDKAYFIYNVQVKEPDHPQAPPVVLPPNYQINVTLAMKQKDRLIAKTKGIIDNTHRSISFYHEREVTKGEEYYFVCTVDRPDYAKYIAIGTPRFYYEGDTIPQTPPASPIPNWQPLDSKVKTWR
jgi:hypothetical protein